MGIYSDFVHELSDNVLFSIRNMERMLTVWRRMQIIDANEFDSMHEVVCKLEDAVTKILEEM